MKYQHKYKIYYKTKEITTIPPDPPRDIGELPWVLPARARSAPAELRALVILLAVRVP